MQNKKSARADHYFARTEYGNSFFFCHVLNKPPYYDIHVSIYYVQQRKGLCIFGMSDMLSSEVLATKKYVVVSCYFQRLPFVVAFMVLGFSAICALLWHRIFPKLFCRRKSFPLTDLLSSWQHACKVAIVKATEPDQLWGASLNITCYSDSNYRLHLIDA